MMRTAPDVVNLDTILNAVGECGRYQWLVEALLCAIALPRTYQILAMYFVALDPPWRCVANSTICDFNGTMTSLNKIRCKIPRSEWEFTESKEYSIVTQFDLYCESEWQIYFTTSILFIGWGIGAVITGWLADNYGRKIVIFPGIATCIMVGFINAFMPSIYPFIICRFLIGLTIPACSVQCFILISEMVGYKSRPLFGNILGAFFTVSLCLLALKAYFIRRWKYLLIMLTVPYLFVMVGYKFIPESFRWLHAKGRDEQAVGLLQKIAKWNGKDYPSLLQLEPYMITNSERKSSFVELFRTRKLAVITLVQGLAWYVIAMVYYGLSLGADDLGGSLYANFILVSVVEFPATFLSIYLCNKFGRKKSVILPMMLGSITCAVIGFVPQEGYWKIGRITLGMFGKVCITISFDSLYVWTFEIFPTSIRSNGMALLQVTSRMGGASSPWVCKGLKALYRNLPFLVMGGAALISACSLVVIDDTNGKITTPDTVTHDIIKNENTYLLRLETKKNYVITA